MTHSEARSSEPRLTFDWTDPESLSQAVVQAIARVSGDDPVSIDPLYDVIDPDSLNALFDGKRGFGGGASGRVTFDYNGYEVVVQADGRGRIRAQEERPPTEGRTSSRSSDVDER